jgi:hypothetical protein
VISGFRRDIDEIRALLGYYIALSGSSAPMVRDNLALPSSRVQETGPIDCPEMSVHN